MPVGDHTSLPRSETTPIQAPHFRRKAGNWWPLILVIIGIALFMPRIISLNQEPAWFSVLSDIFGVIATVTGFILYGMAGREDKGIYAVEREQHRIADFPFHAVYSTAELIDILLPNPTSEILLPDRNIPFVHRDLHDLERTFAEKGHILIRSRSKTGKTRAVIELLRRYLRTSPTILVLKRNSELHVPDFIPDIVPRGNLVILIDDLHNHALACKRQKTTAGAIISRTLEHFIQHCGNQLSEVRLILITRREPECWESLDYDPAKSPWSDIALVDLPDLSTDEARRLVAELANVSPALQLTPEVAERIARTNDGTFYRLILAFRDWRSQPDKRDITLQDVDGLQADLASAWRHRRLILFRHRPQLRYIYATLELMNALGVPARKDLINVIAQSFSNNFILRGYSYLNHLEEFLNKKSSTLITKHWLDVLMSLGTFRLKMASRFDTALITSIRNLPGIGYVVTKRPSVWSRLLQVTYKMVSILISALFYLVIGGFFFGSLIVIITAIIKIIPPIPPSILNYPLGVASAVVLLIYCHYILSELLIRVRLKQISHHVEYIGSTEIPVVKQILVPYDLQVEGSVADLSTQAWVLELMQGQSLTRRNLPLFNLLKRWLTGANLNDIGPEARLSVAEILVQLESQNAWAITNQGETYRLMERYEEALSDFNRAIELDPNYSWAINCRGFTYNQMERYEEALSDFNRAIELDPNYTWAIAQRGETCRLMERYEEALSDFNRAIELNPNYTWAITNRGITYTQMERYEEALSDFNQAIELDLNSDWAINCRGFTYSQMKRYKEALSDLNRAVELDPNSDWAIDSRGETYRLMERYEEALNDFNRAIELNPNSDWAITNRGITYAQMERYEEALSDFNRAIELDPNSNWAIASRGETYRLMERYEEALNDLNRAIELDPNYTWAITNRGKTYRLMERYEEALSDFNQVTELDLNNGRAIAHRGTTYRLMEQYQEALYDFNRAIELDLNDTWAIANRGITYRLMERYQEALHDLNRAIELDPNDTWAIANRGTVYLLMRQSIEALADFDRAIELKPKDDWDLFLRGCAFSALGEQERATNDFGIAISEAKSTYETKPQSWNNTFNLALYLLAAGEAEQAEQIYQQAFSEGVPAGVIRVAWHDLKLLLHIMPNAPHGQEIMSLLEWNIKQPNP